MGRWFLFALVLTLEPKGWAATPFKQTLNVKKNEYLSEGVFTGGRVFPQGTSILAVRRVFSAKASLERVIVTMGDREAKPLKTELGYFQASMDPVNRRLVLDISQMKISKVTEAQVQRLFKNSVYVSSVDFTLDPEDKAASMVINLKQPMRLETFQLHNPARIVMDLKPVPAKVL